MLNVFLKISLFFFLIFLIDATVGQVGDYLSRHAKGGPTKELNDFVENDIHDIIIFGSSRAKHHYDTPFLTDILNQDVYNAGYDGNGVILAYGLLNLILERYTPKTIILDVEPAFDVNLYSPDNGCLRYIKLLKPYYKNHVISMIIKDISPKEWYMLHSGMYRYNTSVVSMLIDNVFNRLSDCRGYKPLCGEMISINRDFKNDELNIDKIKIKYLTKFIELCNTKNIPLILIVSPQYVENTSDILKPVIELCDKYDITFLNFYDDTYFKNSILYKDPMHLNVNGAREFSNYLLKYLR